MPAARPHKRQSGSKRSSSKTKAASYGASLSKAASKVRSRRRSNTSATPESASVDLDLARNASGRRIVGPFYEIEYIEFAEVFKDAKTNKKSWEYMIKWYGYETSDNCAIAEDGFTQSSNIIQSFWRDIGTRYVGFDLHARAHVPATRVHPSPEWIARMSDRAARAVSPTL